jgi:hypothetical protein
MFVFFGLLIYSGATSEDKSSILQTIKNLDTKKVRSITITQENPKSKINLITDTLTVYDENTVHNIILALKELEEKHVTKGATRFWESKLIITFDKSDSPNLKEKDKLPLSVHDTEEGLFIEVTNTMGYETYACQQLKPLLERVTDFQTARGGQN